MRNILRLGLFAGLALGGPAALAQEAGDADAGHALARTWCSGCHMVEPTSQPRAGDTAPSFQAVAQMPSATRLSLRAFLQTPHARMPDWQLTQAQIDDVVTYILSLKGAH